jgi:hypothetical protein
VTGRRRGLALLLAAAVGLGAGAAAASAPAGLLVPYVAAREAGAVGTVEGIAQAEPRRPGQPPSPMEGVLVHLVPYAEDFVQELDRVKAGLRDEARAFLDSGRRVAEAQRRYERRLLGAGGGGMIRGEVSDAAGAFRFASVPAGRWLLLAARTTRHAVASRRLTPAEVRQFRGNPERSGYAAVTYWRVELQVRPGEVAAVTLHDRNGWLTAIEEERRVPDQP